MTRVTGRQEPAYSDGTAASAGWPAVWALAMAVASLNTSELLPASLLTPMAASLRVSEGLVGQSVTATAILAIATSLLIARIARRFDRRHVLLVVAIAQVLSNLIVALAPNGGVLLAGRLLLGLTVGGIWGLSASLALRLVSPAHVARALSIIFGGASISMVVAAPLGAFLGGVIGWRGVFLAVTGLSVAAVVALAATLPSLPTRTTATGSAARPGLSAALRAPGLALGMLGVILLFGGQNMFITYLRPFLEVVAGLGTNGVAVALLAFGAASFLGTVAAPELLRRSTRWTLAAVASAQALTLTLLLLFAHGSQVTATACVAVWGFAVGAVGVGWSSWLAQTYPDHAEAGGGILVAAIQGAMMVGALLGGGLIDAVGPTGPLLASISILAVGAVYTSVTLRARLEHTAAA